FLHDALPISAPFNRAVGSTCPTCRRKGLQVRCRSPTQMRRLAPVSIELSPRRTESVPSDPARRRFANISSCESPTSRCWGTLVMDDLSSLTILHFGEHRLGLLK